MSKEEIKEIDFEVQNQALVNEIEQLKNQNSFFNEQIETLNLSLEIANERWIEQVNKNMQLEIEVRKAKKGN